MVTRSPPKSTLPAASSEMQFFSALVRCGSLSAAARELQVTTPAISKRLALLESRLGVSLLNRTTRRMGLTPEGETYLQNARRILGDIEALERELEGARERPQGLLRVNATLGFGRSHVAPLISSFVRAWPEVEVQLQLSVAPPPLSDDAFGFHQGHAPLCERVRREHRRWLLRHDAGASEDARRCRAQ